LRRERRYPLGMAVSRRQTSINQKAMVVLHQAMADEAELGFLAWSLAVEPCIGIRRRDMRLVRPLLAMEVGFGIAPTTETIAEVKRPGLAFRDLPSGLPLVQTLVVWKSSNTSPIVQNFLECFTNATKANPSAS